MPGIDVFSGDAFGVVKLTDAINNLAFVPGRIRKLKIFSEIGVETTRVAIEQRDNILTLLPPTARGGPGTTIDKEKRNIRDVPVPHFEINDAVMADEVQNIRAFGGESALQGVMEKVAQRLQTHQNNHSFTEEHARLGAIKGIVTYADGGTLNLFDLFGVSQEAEIDFDLDNAAPASGALRTVCHGIHRQMSDLLGGFAFQYVHAFCGDAFFDAVIAHPEVVASYTATDQAAELRRSYVEGGDSYGSFWFAGIKFENYRGKVAGSAMVNTDKCHLFPVGVPDLFRTVWAPADYNETVNTIGRRLYVKQYRMQNDKGIHLDSQMNALHYCTRPKVLIQGKRA